MINSKLKSEKYIKAKESLNPSQRDYFDQLVSEYAFHALKNYGRNWAAYEVLADLIRDGWRPTEVKSSPT